MKGLTPFQTVGPFFDVLLRTRRMNHRAAGPPVVIAGSLLDGAGLPIPDGLIEIWQPDAAYYGWSHTDDGGGFRFEINKPAPVPGPDGRDQAPHVLVSVMARGVLTRYVTRVYFDDEEANGEDPILNLVPEERRKTLIARTTAPGWYKFDIRIQGDDETVFFDV